MKEKGYTEYILTWVALLILTVTTVLVAGLDIRNLSVLIALLIAGTKSSLVAFYFMHLKYENRMFKFMFLFVLSSLSIILFLIFFDYPFRGGA